MEEELRKSGKAIAEYIRQRVESLTNPVQMLYGYESRQSIYDKLTELYSLAHAAGLVSVSQDLLKTRYKYEGPAR